MTNRALWQTLVAADSGGAVALTCDECFAILEFLAGVAADGADPGALRDAVFRHMAHCPNCRAHHLQRLSELEAKLAALKKAGRQ